MVFFIFLISGRYTSGCKSRLFRIPTGAKSGSTITEKMEMDW